MKRIDSPGGAVLAAVILLLPVLPCKGRGAAEQTAAEEPNNAALHYLAAFKLLKPADPAIEARVKKAIREGLHDDCADLEKYIEENEAFFREFAKGTGLVECDFDRGKKPKYLVEKGAPPLLEAWRAIDLYLLRARWKMRRGDFEGAVRDDLSLLVFSRHFFGDDTLIAKAIALNAEAKSLAGLEEILNSPLEGSPDCRPAVAKGLKNHIVLRGEAAKIALDERESVFSAIRLAADRIDAGQDAGKEAREGVAAFKKEFLAEGRRILDDLFGPALEAAKSNAGADWKALDRKIEALKKKDLTKKTLLLYNALAKPAGKDPKAMDSETASRLAGLVILLGFEDFRKITGIFHANLKRLHSLEAAARTGRTPPEKL